MKKTIGSVELAQGYSMHFLILFLLKLKCASLQRVHGGGGG